MGHLLWFKIFAAPFVSVMILVTTRLEILFYWQQWLGEIVWMIRWQCKWRQRQLDSSKLYISTYLLFSYFIHWKAAFIRRNTCTFRYYTFGFIEQRSKAELFVAYIEKLMTVYVVRLLLAKVFTQRICPCIIVIIDMNLF